ncbi:HET-domain-containing protein [Hypoxylon rubiginosum]|uniref:HET-domain-containing protein n=1 Tax=Hypoxylon rubiginosum TaxID=110542 RepID=A0ACC0D6X4_9PEZI|nr:HET-domain-containing protein [Hypoxylon rubiginosum]
MRLLNTSTREFEEFDNDFPPYAILSHTWVKGEEVTLQDLQKYHEFIAQDSPASTSISSRVGFKKIEGCCDLALRDGLNYAWIDTCCIDKTSSAELTEAINSMFKWYKGSDVCYAYLAEVKDATEDFSAADSSFRQSSWFKRGWTLQELLAPRKIQFFSKEWELIGQMDKFTKLCDVVSSITLIPPIYLEGKPLREASVAQRMSWASNRETTREEDIAYSLLGIFDVNMPLLYGEGNKAFRRLQEAIMASIHDHTILAWGYLPWDEEYSTRDTDSECPILATSPADFRSCYDLVGYGRPSPYEMTNMGLKIQLRPRHLKHHEQKMWPGHRHLVVALNCFSQRGPSRQIAIILGHDFDTRVFHNLKLCIKLNESEYDSSTIRCSPA